MKDAPDYSERTHIMSMKVLLNGTDKKTGTVPVEPLAAHHHLCKHLYHPASSAAVYALGGPDPVEWPVHAGAQDGGAVGSVFRRGNERTT